MSSCNFKSYKVRAHITASGSSEPNMLSALWNSIKIDSNTGFFWNNCTSAFNWRDIQRNPKAYVRNVSSHIYFRICYRNIWRYS